MGRANGRGWFCRGFRPVVGWIWVVLPLVVLSVARPAWAADSDGDGLADWWESRHFGGPTLADPTADADGDGTPEACEVCAGGNDSADADGDGTPDA